MSGFRFEGVLKTRGIFGTLRSSYGSAFGPSIGDPKSLKPQRGSHIPTLGPQYVPYTYMAPGGETKRSSEVCRWRITQLCRCPSLAGAFSLEYKQVGVYGEFRVWGFGLWWV